jgi:hypothetical protein
MALSKVDVGCGGTGLVAAGSDGNVLTSDGTDWTSAAPAGGGSWNVVSSTAISSGTSSLNITSGFTSAYEHYVIQLTNLTNSTNSTVNMRIAHGSASFQTGANYRGHISEARSNSGSYSTTAHSGSTLIEFMYNSAHLSATVHISNPADTSLPKHMYWDGSAENGSGDMGGVKGWMFYDATDAVTGIQWWPGSGTFNSGRATVYGIAHA